MLTKMSGAKVSKLVEITRALKKFRCKAKLRMIIVTRMMKLGNSGFRTLLLILWARSIGFFFLL